MDKSTDTTKPISQTIPFIQIASGTIISFALLLIGFISGHIYNRKAPTKMTQQIATNSVHQQILVPKGAYEIQGCQGQNGKYAEYAQPQAIPHGPIYLTYQNKVIGIEYMIDKEQFLTQRLMQFVDMPKLQVNHVTVKYVPNGHPGYEKPHYHVDFFQVPPSVEKEISCDEKNMPPASASATIIPSLIRH
jgi:hypothetical protein